MRCPRCQHENAPDSAYCDECGARLETACPVCDQSSRPGAKFCRKCGHALGEDVAAAAPASRFESPRSYTPRHLADRILTSRAALEGERKQVTVLFCDLVDSTVVAERLGPERMHDVLNRFFELALGEVHRYEGTINQFLGDGVMALFGAPVAHEDHARRGVLAALGIRRAVAEQRAAFAIPGDLTLAVRMGLNTGRVVVGKIGDDLRMDYTAVGDTTHLAARLQQSAEPGAILVSEATRRLVAGHVELERLGLIPVKGRPEPVEAHRVLGRSARRSPLEMAAARRLTRFVGRQRELATLHDLLAEAGEGRGQVVGVVGEPGIGKSRLVHEFRESLAGKGTTWLEGRCVSYGSTIPYLPVVDVIRTQCGVVEADTPAGVAAKVRTALARAEVDVEEAAPYFLRLLGVKDMTGRVDALSPEALKERTFETLRQAILIGSRRRPIVFVVEDVHWIDRTSDELFETLAERSMAARVLLLATYRPGYRPPWIQRSYATQLVLRPLSRLDSRALIESAAAAGSLPERLVKRLLAKAEGNAFFLEELTRTVSDGDDDGDDRPVPDSVQAVLAARIDRLPDEAKQVLQTAAVLGREFSPRLLALMSEHTGRVSHHLDEFRRLEFLYERGAGDETVYVFKHALTQEVAYATLLTSRRRALHAAAARALEVLYRERLEEVYGRLAHHYAGAEDDARAAEYLGRSAEQAARLYAHGESAAALGEALAYAERLPGDARDRRTVELALRLGESLHFLGRRGEIVELLETYRKRVERLADPRLTGAFHFRLGFTHSFLGDREQAGRSIMRALAAAAEAGDQQTMGRVKILVGMERAWAGRFAEGVQLLGEGSALAEGAGDRWWRAWAHHAMGFFQCVLGEFDRAMQSAETAEAIGVSLADRRLRALGLQAKGFVHAVRREAEESLQACRTGLELSPDPFETALLLGVLGAAYLEAGDHAQALAVLEQALHEAKQYRSRQVRAWFAVWLARASVRAGRLAEAHAQVEWGLDLSREVSFQWGVAEGQWVAALIARARGAASEAEAALGAALESFETIGSPHWAARVRLDLARLSGEHGDRAGAEARLRQAHETFARLGLARDAREAERVAGELGLNVP